MLAGEATADGCGPDLCATLVGIAGEDDLDAPDLTDPNLEIANRTGNSKTASNGGQQARPDHLPRGGGLSPRA